MPELLSPTQLSRELREETSADLSRRRWAIGLSFGGALIGMIVGAYQTGLIKHLPEVMPGDLFDSDKVDASDYAYENLQMPDAMQMVVNYGITASLVSAGGKDRAEQNAGLPVVAAAKAGFDLVLCLVLGVKEWRTNQKLCSYCQTATLISAATVALTVPEAARALGRRQATA